MGERSLGVGLGSEFEGGLEESFLDFKMGVE